MEHVSVQNIPKGKKGKKFHDQIFSEHFVIDVEESINSTALFFIAIFAYKFVKFNAIEEKYA